MTGTITEVRGTWEVADFTGGKQVVKEGTTKEKVMIRKCKDVTIEIPHKVLAIAMVACENVEVHAAGALGGMELSGCKDVKVAAESLPSALIDGCAGVTITLPAERSTIQITSALSSEMNLLIKDKDANLQEYPIPQQFVHHVENGKLISSVSDLYG